MKRKYFIAIFIFFVLTAYAQKFENIALTPPMGWNSWNHFGCDINEKIVREIADSIISTGMKDAGYLYINIDDCWQGERDSLGFIHPDSARFPSGMKALAGYIHSKGLKFGIYSDAGWKTCGGRPASRGYEYQDALQYAEWGVDYLKYDWCNTEGLKEEGAYLTMRNALYSAGRPVVFSICEWGNSKPWLWGKDIGHLWRTTGDITNCFDCVVDHGTWKSWGIMHILDMQNGLRAYAGPGHWNDPDMMEVGNGMSLNEDRAHFSMWCMLSAPLIAGNNIRKLNDDTERILTNKEVIAVDQDKLGIQGFKYSSDDSIEVWFKPLQNDEWAVCFLNRGLKLKEVSFDWSKEKIIDTFSGRQIDTGNSHYQIRNLWTKNEMGSTKKILTAQVPGHDVLMIKLHK